MICKSKQSLPVLANSQFHHSGRRNEVAWMDGAESCEGPGTNPSVFPVLGQTGTPQETED